MTTKKQKPIPRKSHSHKGQNGRVLVVGGSTQFVGAVALAGIAALRTGCDLVTIVAPEKIAWAINALTPDIITTKLKGKKFTTTHISTIMPLAKKADVVLIGNGIHEHAAPFVVALIKRLTKIGKKMVIDADGIKALRANAHIVKNAVLTPHACEFRVLLGSNVPTTQKDMKRLEIAKQNVILLKGATDYIIHNGKVQKNKTGNSGMTVGGTGDVLAGMVAGYIAQGVPLEKAALRAAKECGTIGNRLLKKYDLGFIASDFIPLIKTIKHTRHGGDT